MNSLRTADRAQELFQRQNIPSTQPPSDSRGTSGFSVRNCELTWGFVLPEVDVGQHEVDDGWTVLLRGGVLWFEHIALLQALPVKHVGVYLGERKLVHFGPFFSQQDFLERGERLRCIKASTAK